MSADVWLFFAAADRTATRDHRDHIQRRCAERGWIFQPRSVQNVRSAKGRPVPMVATDVAAGLYPRLHRRRVATLVIGRDPVVPLDPNVGEALRSKRHWPLRRYVNYKCFWARLPLADAVNESWLGSFASWCGAVGCDGENDPRCLPFHAFDGDGRGLDRDEGRSAFDARYGNGSLRTDERSAEWKMTPRIFHGSDQLEVSGRPLRRGCHWDVTASQYRISTPAGLWLVDGHVNIYPDAHVRGQPPSVRQLR
jgi:hypothetical protein